MADFSKYLGKLDNNIQDWSKIGKDISDDLQKVLQQRRDDRAKIDKQTREAIDKVNQVELGQNKTFNQFLLNGTGQTKQFMLMQERLLKRGILKPQDYLNSTQVIKDDWQNLSNAAKSFNADYEEAMKRIQDGDAAGQEAYQNKKYDAFANIQNKSIFVNPVDGRLYLTTSDKEGNIIRDPASMINVNAINARQKDKINKVDVTAEVKNATGALGEVVKAINEGGILTRQDKRLMEITVDGEKTTFEEAKNDIIESLMTSPRNNASILTDTIGGYTFTEIESEKGGKVIYLKEDGLGLLQPELTEEQEEAVREKLDMEIEKQLGFKEESTYATDVASADRAKGRALEWAKLNKKGKEQKENLSSAYSYAVDLASGDPDRVQRSIGAIAGTHPELVFTPSDDGIGYDVLNRTTGIKSKLRYTGKGNEEKYTDQIFNVLVGAKGVSGLGMTEKARDSYYEMGNQLAPVRKSNVGTSEQLLPTNVSILSQGSMSMTDEDGNPRTVNAVLGDEEVSLTSAGDYRAFIESIELPEGFEDVNLEEYIKFKDVGSGRIKMTYPHPTDKTKVIVTAFNPSDTEVNRGPKGLRKFLEEAFTTITNLENKNRQQRSEQYRQASQGQGAGDALFE